MKQLLIVTKEPSLVLGFQVRCDLIQLRSGTKFNHHKCESKRSRCESMQHDKLLVLYFNRDISAQ